LQEPLILLFLENTLGQGHEIRRHLGALNTKKHDPTAAIARKRRRILQRRPSVRREVSWEEDVPE
jgi:hypothetical protein